MDTSPQPSPVSVLTGHFPEIRFEQGQRRLWNPVRKNVLADRPEERVRLQLVEWLRLSCALPVSRFTTELPVKPRITGQTLRTDLLCFDKQHRPWLLAECKAPDIRLTRQTAMQASRYNLEIGAPLVLLTNGRRDIFFDVSDDGITPRLLSDLETGSAVTRDTTYWQRRGFMGQALPETLKPVFSEILRTLHQQAGAEIHLIQLPASAENAALNHYFFLREPYLISLSAHHAGGTMLDVLHHQNGQISGHLRVRLLPSHQESVPETAVQLTDSKGSRNLDAAQCYDLLNAAKPETSAANIIRIWAAEFDSIFR